MLTQISSFPLRSSCVSSKGVIQIPVNEQTGFPLPKSVIDLTA